ARVAGRPTRCRWRPVCSVPARRARRENRATRDSDRPPPSRSSTSPCGAESTQLADCPLATERRLCAPSSLSCDDQFLAFFGVVLEQVRFPKRAVVPGPGVATERELMLVALQANTR